MVGDGVIRGKDHKLWLGMLGLHHEEDVYPWGRSPEGLEEPLSLEWVQVSARQQTWLSTGSHQEEGIDRDFQRSLPAKHSWDDNLPAGIHCGKI